MQEDAVIQIVLPIEPDCIGIIGREQLECAGHERVVDAEHSVNALFLFIDLSEEDGIGAVGLEAFEIV